MEVVHWMLDHPMIGLLSLVGLIAGVFSIGTCARQRRDSHAFMLGQSPSSGPDDRLDAQGVTLHLVFLISYALGTLILLGALPLLPTLFFLAAGGSLAAP